MATVTEIGSLISRRPEIRGGRPCIAGTGISVRTIAVWHNMGLIPEEIARKMHLSLAQFMPRSPTITPIKPKSTRIWQRKSARLKFLNGNTRAKLRESRQALHRRGRDGQGPYPRTSLPL